MSRKFQQSPLADFAPENEDVSVLSRVFFRRRELRTPDLITSKIGHSDDGCARE